MLQAFLQNVFICFRRMFASVLICMLHMFHIYVTRVCSKYFSLMLQQVFSCCKCLSRSCIRCNGYTCMLQMFQLFSEVCCKCFIWLLQVFYLDVAYVAVAIYICCKHMFPNILSVLDVCWYKCFMLQLFSLVGTKSERM
jgi:hypothetical protein